MQIEHFFILVRDNINNSGNRIRRSWKINFLISGLVKRLLDRKSDTARSWYKWTFLDVVPVLSKKQKPSWQSVCGWGNYQQEMFKKGAMGGIPIQMAATESIIKLSPKAIYFFNFPIFDNKMPLLFVAIMLWRWN